MKIEGHSKRKAVARSRVPIVKRLNLRSMSRELI